MSVIEKAVARAKTTPAQDFEWGQLNWYVSRPLGNSTTMTAGRCVLKPGHFNPRHRHPNCDEVLFVVSGKIIHTLGAEEIEMGPGDVISIPTNVVHNAKNIGKDDAVLLIAFSSADRETIGE